MTDPIEYPDFVRTLVKSGEAVLASLTPAKADALHAVLGIAGEAGELVDVVKRWTLYDKPIDRVTAVEELGDLEFYMEQLRQRLDITREETIVANVAKLQKRYHEGKYSDAQAQARADKRERPVPGTEMRAWIAALVAGDVIEASVFGSPWRRAIVIAVDEELNDVCAAYEGDPLDHHWFTGSEVCPVAQG